MTLRQSVFMAGFALPSAALACESSVPAAAPAGITIAPTVACQPGHAAEFIRLSRSLGDPVDSVFALCRDPSKDKERWAADLASTRDKLLANIGDPAAKAAVRAAFDRRIAVVRAGQ